MNAKIEQTASATELLAAKKKALTGAELALQEAEAGYNEDVITEVRLKVDALKGIVQRLEPEAAAELETAARAEAEARMVGIHRGHAALMKQRAEDLAKETEAAQALREARERVNERSRRLWKLETEARALADRFGISVPPALTAPEVFFAAGAEVHAIEKHPAPPHTEQDTTGLGRRRRTYSEVAGTPGFEIIMRAGLRPWPELSDRQREIVDSLEEQKERAEVAVRALPDLSQVPPDVPLSAGIRYG